jgi:phosphate transport system permease protein
MREFLFGTTWSPDYTGDYGTVPLLKGTLQIAFGACALGVPMGIGSALYLSEFAPARVRSVVKPAIEVLSGIPSIIFGLIAIFVVGPWIQQTFHTPQVFSALAATLALSIMVVPIVCSIAEDAIRAVPRELRDGALALGATPWETAWAVTLPAARSGLTAAVLLGFSRAVGETMVVTLAAGLIPTLSVSYLQPAQTFTAFIANRAGGDVPAGSMAFSSIFALGLYLFVLTLALNVTAQLVLARHRRRFA